MMHNKKFTRSDTRFGGTISYAGLLWLYLNNRTIGRQLFNFMQAIDSRYETSERKNGTKQQV